MTETAQQPASIPMADSDEICRLVADLPWDALKAIVTIRAHCTAIVDTVPPDDVKDLAACISHNCLELATALRSHPQAPASVLPHAQIARAAALMRKVCQLFDSGGESQRSVRARFASAAFQTLDPAGLVFDAEYRKCDDDPVSYLANALPGLLPDGYALSPSQPASGGAA